MKKKTYKRNEKKNKIWKGYNWCYIYDDDGDLWLKEECSECSHCAVDNLYFEFICDLKEKCEFG